ncbi:winged helix-turn-helix domain-containing protein [uncultured Paraglaciecola sp.]|uniref:winged helix-turn-helix domain-containing protein n=1 Tax=uncultured Paraglaciecola sp. TaxID=1765024 RepID=UPI0030DA91B5|tara:strand:+ start:207882 stop:210017 length:2136 start_codon:yes stop_codon:yes gene_type:complete
MLQLGEFILDCKQARLFCGDDELAIEPKLFELLLLFVDHPNSIISRQDILDKLWENSLVTDNAINKMVANLRKLLSDDAQNPRYIQTIPKRGYRLICEVSTLQDPNSILIDQPKGEQSEKTANNQPSKLKSYPNKTIITLMLLFFAWVIWQIFKSNNKDTSRYSISLTRANGAEESARMHPNANDLYFLKRTSENTAYSLYIKDVNTAKITEVDIGNTSISNIFAVVAGLEKETTHLLYHDKKPDSCGVYQALISKNKEWLNTKKLFACNGKRIKDLDYHISKKVVYYAAQPQNFWPNQIYAYDLTTKKHRFVTQVEPRGRGHYSIDISPDGNKLLVMSADSDYKTQLLVLNLLDNQMTEGLTFDYHVSEAIWHHDSEQIYYYGAAPAKQIIKSDLYGKNASQFVSVSENLSPRMSLFPDGKNLLFSTEQKNFSNRWLVAPSQVDNIDNSAVADVYPTLFHHSLEYLFISKRSGRQQLYLGNYHTNKAEIVSNFSSSDWLGYMAISGDDKRVLLNVENKVYAIPTSDLSQLVPLTTLKPEHLIFTSNAPIISVDWLSIHDAAITKVKNGIPELVVISLQDNRVKEISGEWAYGLSDQQHPEYSYFIERRSNALFRTHVMTKSTKADAKQQKFSSTQVTLPDGFFHVKIDANTLYYGSSEKGIDYLNAVSLSNTENSQKYPSKGFSSYDVYDGNIILSDVESLEGDVHRTMD